MASSWERLALNITVIIQALGLEEEGERECAGYYKEATTQTVKRGTEANEPLMREYHICL